MIAKGDGTPYEDNNTAVERAGQRCLMVHGNVVDNDGYGFSVEVQLDLDERTDMSGEDYQISYDIYIPEETYEKGANVQFALYQLPGYTPIYSEWYSSSLKSGEWVTLTTPIDTTSGLISYSGFENDPEDWAFDAVRIQTIINGEGAATGDEISFCIDNLRIEQVQAPGDDDDDDEPDETAPSPYTVTIDGDAVPVERVGKFAVPVSYVHLGHPGTPVTVQVELEEGIEEYSLSPASRNIAADLDGGVLSFTVDEPAYLILEVPEQERLFLLLDPAEEGAPAPDDANVVNLLDDASVDATGQEESTEAIQAAIDAASAAERNIVYVPAGKYLTDSLFLRDDMTLYLERGAVLVNATPQADLISNAQDLTVIEGSSHGFIVMDGVQNARLMGRGTIDGNGTELQSYGRKMFLVKIENSSGCLVDGILSRDSAFWNTLIYRSEDITIQNYKVINNRLDGEWNETDGVDFDNCVDSTLTNAFLYTGDDCMAVKSDDIPDDFEIEGILDPTAGEYMNVSNITHERIVCFSGSSACKVGTKTFGESMSAITFTDVDVVAANRALVIDAVDTATISGTVFEDIRIESVTGRLVDFNMDPKAIEWRTNPGICTVNDTSVANVSSAVSAEILIKGNIHDYNEASDPYHGNEYYIDGVHFSSLTIQGEPVTSIDDEDASFNLNEYATDITFEP